MSHVLKKNAGFTLIEVLISLVILLNLVMAVTSILRFSVDIRASVSQRSKVTHRLNLVMQNLSHDLSHAYLVDSSTSLENNVKRTIFQITKTGDSDALALTTLGHRPRKKDAREADTAFVYYELKDAKDRPGRKDLYRGVLAHIPTEFDTRPEPMLIAEDIQSIRLDPWVGDDWGKSTWDSSRSSERNKMPHMVRVVVRAWANESVGESSADTNEQGLEQVASVVYIPMALDFDEVKTRVSDFRF